MIMELIRKLFRRREQQPANPLPFKQVIQNRYALPGERLDGPTPPGTNIYHIPELKDRQ